MSKYLNSPREADWYACPTCGDEVRVGSEGCRQCGGRDADGEDSFPEGVELPEEAEDFDYKAWAEKEFGMASKIKPSHLPWKYWVGGILVLVALLWMAVFGGLMRY